MTSPDYCIIVNELFEAKFFIDKFELEHKNEFKLFPIYTDSNKKIWLSINVKKKFSKIIPIYLQNVSNANLRTKWFFFTFSITGSNNLHEFFIIDEIFFNLKEKKHYPAVIGMKKLLRKPVYSVKKINLKKHFLQTQNSFEIYNTLQKVSFRELIAMTSISIGHYPILSIKQKINLIEHNFKKISIIFKNLKKFDLIINFSGYSENLFNFITKRINFTFYEKVILKKLLRKVQKNNYKLFFKEMKNMKDVKSIINYLENIKNC